jgi:lipopolysaccharide biosynthesis regulator YciM
VQDFELWWLLVFPVFFGLGWLAARVDMREVLGQARRVPASYFTGLQALVDDKTEQAASALAEVVRHQPRAAELHVALARLYRKRGEHDLAIRLLTQLLQHYADDLTPLQRDATRFELAQNFLRAGLIDRAEEILVKLDHGTLAHEARKCLLEIYQQERNWPRAIELARELKSEDFSFQHELAQYHCELAQGALIKSDFASARSHVNDALAASRRSCRASLIAGDIHLAQGEVDEAIRCWQGIESQNPDYLSLAAERLFDAYDRQGRAAEGLVLLRGYLRSYPQLELLDVLYPKIAAQHGDAVALEFLRDTVRARPSLTGLGRLIEAQQAGFEPEQRVDAELGRTLVQSHGKRLNVYRCKRCNFRSKVFFWHCPACGEWESFTPNRTETQ